MRYADVSQVTDRRSRTMLIPTTGFTTYTYVDSIRKNSRTLPVSVMMQRTREASSNDSACVG